MNRTDLQRLSRVRIREARALFAENLHSGAYYLAGYAVELALKSCIARATQRYDFPDKERAQRSYSHKLSDLLNVANLAAVLEKEKKANPQFEASWTLVNNWSEQSRYTVWNRVDAYAMIRAVGNPQVGVLRWIRRHW